MHPLERSGVFLSYARADGEQFAAALRQRLQTAAPDLTIKQDRLSLEGGVGFWKQITQAIDSVEFLILAMTPAAIESPMVRKEWRYARQQGVCVYPVKAAPDSALHFAQLPRWMSKAHFFDLDNEWETFLAHLRKGCDKPRVPFMPPDLPENFVERPDEFNRLKNLLLAGDRNEPVAIATALSGAGGFGKTTLAAAVCHDEDIIENFDDGILWVTLGQNPDVLGNLITVYAALTGERPGFVSVEDAGFQLGQKLEDRTCLLVVDDVWDDAHLRPFLRGGKHSARLFTTRNAEIASAHAQPVNVDEMRESESLALLTKGVPEISTAQARLLSQRLGEWPLALEIARATTRQRIQQGDSAARAIERLLQTLARKGPSALARGTGDPRHRTIDSVIQSSLELLSAEDRRRLIELSIFPEDIAIPLTAAAALWALDEFDAEDLVQRFARLYLLKFDLARAALRLHDVMRSWLAAQIADAAGLHSRLVDAWHSWPQLPDPYAWRWLTWHLAEAGRTADLERLLWDPDWLQAKLTATDVNSLIADFDRLQTRGEAQLIQIAIRLSSHILAQDPAQFISQIFGRLLLHNDRPEIQRFTDSLAHNVRQHWFRTLWPTLDPPGTALVRTLVGHSGSVAAVALTPDGRRGVSASTDRTLKLWDLQTGAELRTLTGHSLAVTSVALTPDGCHAVSGSYDQTLKLWDLEIGAELRTFNGHSDAINAVALTRDGRRAVSASADETLKLWDLETGAELGTFIGHSGAVTAVALTSDGSRAVSASADKTVKLWDFETGAELRTLIGHSLKVTAVALTMDGRRAVSASHDRMLKLWDLETGTALRTLSGHSHWVTSVALSLDGSQAVSGSYDRTLKLWDLETGAVLRTFSGHSQTVNAVALTSGGTRAISASEDRTLKLWDFTTGAELRKLTGHSSAVNAVALSPDRRRAISGFGDHTLKLLDLETGAELRILSGHSQTVSAVAITADGLRAVSASWDHTLKLWDLEAGAVLRTLSGHSNWVTSVAITPDGRRAISGAWDKMLKLWDLESGAVLRTLSGHSHWVTSVALSLDGAHAISGSYDKTVKLWDLETGAVLRTFSGHSAAVTAVALTSNGHHAVSASWDNTLKLWDLETGAELRTFAGHSALVTAVALAPDGRRAASTSADNTLRVWDLSTGALISIFTCDAAANCCAFVDKCTILAGDAAGRIHLLTVEFPASPSAFPFLQRREPGENTLPFLVPPK